MKTTHAGCGGNFSVTGQTEVDGEKIDVYFCDKCGINTMKPIFEGDYKSMPDYLKPR